MSRRVGLNLPITALGEEEGLEQHLLPGITPTTPPPAPPTIIISSSIVPQVEFLPAAALTSEELERQRAAAEQAAKATRSCAFEMDGAPAAFDILFRQSMKTNGGWMYDITVTFQVGAGCGTPTNTTHSCAGGRWREVMGSLVAGPASSSQPPPSPPTHPTHPTPITHTHARLAGQGDVPPRGGGPRLLRAPGEDKREQRCPMRQHASGLRLHCYVGARRPCSHHLAHAFVRPLSSPCTLASPISSPTRRAWSRRRRCSAPSPSCSRRRCPARQRVSSNRAGAGARAGAARVGRVGACRRLAATAWPRRLTALRSYLTPAPLRPRPRPPPHAPGLLLSSQFSTNYFSISQVEQFFDDFADDFKGARLGDPAAPAALAGLLGGTALSLPCLLLLSCAGRPPLGRNSQLLTAAPPAAPRPPCSAAAGPGQVLAL